MSRLRTGRSNRLNNTRHIFDAHRLRRVKLVGHQLIHLTDTGWYRICRRNRVRRRYGCRCSRSIHSWRDHCCKGLTCCRWGCGDRCHPIIDVAGARLKVLKIRMLNQFHFLYVQRVLWLWVRSFRSLEGFSWILEYRWGLQHDRYLLVVVVQECGSSRSEYLVGSIQICALSNWKETWN